MSISSYAVATVWEIQSLFVLLSFTNTYGWVNCGVWYGGQGKSSVMFSDVVFGLKMLNRNLNSIHGFNLSADAPDAQIKVSGDEELPSHGGIFLSSESLAFSKLSC